MDHRHGLGEVQELEGRAEQRLGDDTQPDVRPDRQAQEVVHLFGHDGAAEPATRQRPRADERLDQTRSVEDGLPLEQGVGAAADLRGGDHRARQVHRGRVGAGLQQRRDLAAVGAHDPRRGRLQLAHGERLGRAFTVLLQPRRRLRLRRQLEQRGPRRAGGDVAHSQDRGDLVRRDPASPPDQPRDLRRRPVQPRGDVLCQHALGADRLGQHGSQVSRPDGRRVSTHALPLLCVLLGTLCAQ